MKILFFKTSKVQSFLISNTKLKKLVKRIQSRIPFENLQLQTGRLQFEFFNAGKKSVRVVHWVDGSVIST